MEIKWIIKSYQSLSTDELYAILQLRAKVFVVEQNCNYLDLDGYDKEAFHVMGYDEKGNLVAVTRIFDKGISYDEAAIGRVATAHDVRKLGIGKELMRESIEAINNIFGKQAIKIGAQLYLQRFYESFGFKQVSDMYLEDDIPHIKMLREADQ
ncbi:GNAT family N-acetyltransferase [Chitinophaga caeni]|uniref:GNAT family N-acetyltransferase n=1 Tax=Chitinophaga caeni TaxID=2029983 RepID=A0A291QQC1_9BACT|nr:GNAT family N-acetyltransferase [Chitinophaga caeni]ATL46093.1 GNAT family N-acetyltransferase [Chitinophaga caeni]